MTNNGPEPTDSEPKPIPEPQTPEEDASGSFAAYTEYNRVLRTWFVALGIGGPALFLVNSTLAEKLAAAGHLRIVVFLFLTGATAQVLGALLNKIANWYAYAATIDPKMKGTRRERFADWLFGSTSLSML